MTHIGIIVKKPGELPSYAQTEDEIGSIRAIVGGHVMFKTIGNDGRNRFAVAYHLHRDASFNAIVDGFAFNGTIALLKLDPEGRRLSFDDDERAEWIDYFSKLNSAHSVEERPGPMKRSSPEPIINDRHSIQLIPADIRDEESSKVLTPEQVIERNAARYGLVFEHVPLTNQNVYGAALVVIDASEVGYSVIDESTMLLAVGDNSIPHHLRVIEIFDIETEEGRSLLPHLGNSEH